jgi:hypothetical protein
MRIISTSRPFEEEAMPVRVPVQSGILAALSLASSLDLATEAHAATAVDYAQPSSWLCRPGRQDVCSAPETSTVVSPGDGARTRKTYTPDPDAPIDCFYVYPTVSQEPTANADLTPGPGEARAAAEQFARFGAVCRAFAPIYRQTTVAAMHGDVRGADPDLAYGDVLAAWKSYLARDNGGRGVVLVGHSQGANHLIRLIAEEVDGKPAQRLLVSAILIGGNVEVASGSDAGGSFRRVPLCRKADQTGCVIAYSSFLADHPPAANAWFGKAEHPGMSVACVNPAALLDQTSLDSELFATPAVKAVLGTPLVENPGLISAACTAAGDRTYLAVTVKPTGVGAATLGHALADLDKAAPQWGLHPIDVSLTLGDLVEIVGRQGKAWAAAPR